MTTNTVEHLNLNDKTIEKQGMDREYGTII